MSNVERLRLTERFAVVVFVMMCVAGLPALCFGHWLRYPTEGVPNRFRAFAFSWLHLPMEIIGTDRARALSPPRCAMLLLMTGSTPRSPAIELL